jgi:mannosyl-3-phosphoglycerate phosphatase
LRQTSTVVFCSIDSIVPIRGKALAGFDEFGAALEHAGVPLIWVTTRSRAQIDEPVRRFGHKHPFVGEDGCGVFLPSDYFHLRPEKAIRLGRFTCIPVAMPQPAASEALDSLSEATGVSVVSLRSLSPRELEQNLGLPAREAELARQRDFDEPFFFAGTAQADIDRFTAEASLRKIALRQHGVLWSLAVGADLRQCVRHLSKLYDRALRAHLTVVGIASAAESDTLFPACDRTLLLERHPDPESLSNQAHQSRPKVLSLHARDLWDQALQSVTSKA